MAVWWEVPLVLTKLTWFFMTACHFTVNMEDNYGSQSHG